MAGNQLPVGHWPTPERVRVTYSEKHQLHAPRTDVQAGKSAESVELPERAERILHALQKHAAFEVQPPTEHGLTPIEAVHSAGLIAFLRETRPESGLELFPDSFLHPGVREGMGPPAAEPGNLLGRLGWWCFDTGTPILDGTYAAARAAVDVALTAADLVLHAQPVAYGLCRPPGHHAARSLYGGFCYFNNAAIAANYLVERTGEKVAILDIDYHHGNGSQQIFYDRDDVLYVSLHADPRRDFPYFSGHVDETGTGAGLGCTRNFPLPAGINDADYVQVLDSALETVVRFRPGVTIVSLGIDTYEHDPLGDFELTTPVYAECARRIAAVAPRLVVLQEGGYFLPDLGENVRQFLLGCTAGSRSD
jgi:acetoin utilization deacetylase AcuC-like enzyme